MSVFRFCDVANRRPGRRLSAHLLCCFMICGVWAQNAAAQNIDVHDAGAQNIDAVQDAGAQNIDAVQDAGAQPFYDGRFLEIGAFPGVMLAPCSEEIAAAAGGLCYQIGENGSAGAVLMTVRDGYRLADRQAMALHLSQSRAALAGIVNVEVISAEILPSDDQDVIVGRMEVVRRDRGVADLFGLVPPLRQISYLYPFGSQLTQVFIYVGSGAGSDETLAGIEPSLKNPHFKSKQTDCIEENGGGCANVEKNAAADASAGDGVLSLLPRALLYGAAIALTIILFLHLNARRRRRRNDDAQNLPND